MITKNIEYEDYVYKISIGKNAQENWDIISSASQNDIWFHLGKDMPSPHVILKIPNLFKLKKIPNYITKQCALLCKIHSKYNNIKKVPIIYTEIKNVIKTNIVGSVYTSNTKTIII